MSGVSREEAVALGEGVTAGPWWSEGVDEDDRHLILGADHTEIAEMPVYGPHRSPENVRIILAAPRLRETVVELHDRVAELTAEVERLRAEAEAASNKDDGLDSWRLRHCRKHVGALIRDGAAVREALGVDCALNELPARAAALRADNEALHRELHDLRVAFGRQITEQARARLTPDERLACLRAEAASLARILDALPPGISRQSGEARLAEVERQIEEETP